MKYQKYIEFILFDSPSDDEMKKFNNELIINPLLKEEYEFFLTALQRINGLESSIKNDVKSMNDFEFDPEIEEIIHNFKKDVRILKTGKTDTANHIEKKDNENLFISSNKRGWFKAAAVLMVFIIIPSAFVLTSLYPRHIIIDINRLDCPKYAPTLTRSIATTSVTALKPVEYYYKGLPDSALIYMSDRNVSKLIEESDPLFFPVCLMEVGKPEEAARLLCEITSDDLDYSEALWYIAICDLQSGKKEEAETVLKQLKALDPSFNKVANKIRKEIRHRKEVIIIFSPSKYYASKTVMSSQKNNSDKEGKNQ
jgi:hypothetical protein